MNRRWVAGLLVIGIGVFLAISYMYFKSEFKMISGTSMKRDFFIAGETYYFGHEMKWQGAISPTIEKISVVRKDGIQVNENEPSLTLIPFLDYSRHTGVLSEQEYQKMVSQNQLDYEAVGENKLKKDEFTLVFKVLTNDKQRDYQIGGILMRYRVLGIAKEQYFEYKGFLSD